MEKFYLTITTSSPNGNSGIRVGGKYDLYNSCKKCGVPYKLLGNLPIKNYKVNVPFFQTFQGHNIISDKIYNYLIFNDIKFLYPLKQIVNVKGEFLPYYHLQSELYFPKMIQDESNGILSNIKELCPICKRAGYFDIPNENPHYVYEYLKKDFLEISDIFSTWEYFGYSILTPVPTGRFPVLPNPKLIVSERFKSVFESKKIKKVEFFEIRIKNIV